jgi:Bacterial tandem repeat domain 1
VLVIGRLGGLGACAAVLASLLAGADPASAHPGAPASVFDPDVVSWASYRNYTPSEFNARVTEQTNAGRLPIDVDADASGSSYLLGGAFQTNRDSRSWLLLHGVTVAQLDQAIDAHADKRLVDLESYVLNGVRRYAALFVQTRSGPGGDFEWDFRRNVTRAELDGFVSAQQTVGRMPIDIDAYQVGSELRYDVISVRNIDDLDWTLVRDLTSAQFDDVFESHRDTHRPLVADSYTTPNGQRYAGIWIDNENNRGWTILWGLTVDGWAAAWQQQLDAGNRVINFERYQTASGTRYLGIWRQND